MHVFVARFYYVYYYNNDIVGSDFGMRGSSEDKILFHPMCLESRLLSASRNASKKNSTTAKWKANQRENFGCKRGPPRRLRTINGKGYRVFKLVIILRSESVVKAREGDCPTLATLWLKPWRPSVYSPDWPFIRSLKNGNRCTNGLRTAELNFAAMQLSAESEGS
jgi:hypothetical protein